MNLNEPTIIEKSTEEADAPYVVRQRNKLRWITVVVTFFIVISLIASIVIAALYVPEVAIYIPFVALGLAWGLQKYITSFFAYFYINFTRIYEVGDRIRIGNIKGDVRRVGMLHTTLEEVGEDEKLGGELTGRLLHVPNLTILDLPALNYSKDYSVKDEVICSDYLVDEVRIPITVGSDAQAASDLLNNILKRHDKVHIREIQRKFKESYPKFIDEAKSGIRVQLYVEPEHIWIKGKFVVPLKRRNEVRSKILLEFFKAVRESTDIKMA
ncbi:MAG: mechanosensitive ion channel family protein [Dehalococcoidia bacterium]|nr:mechanosensitive ion channel family protein [Dehalococcoidia bacterium]